MDILICSLVVLMFILTIYAIVDDYRTKKYWQELEELKFRNRSEMISRFIEALQRNKVELKEKVDDGTGN